MPDPRGWPNPAKLGFPTNPDLEGPHLIEDEHGKRRLMWWLPHTVVWFSSSLQLPPILAGERWTYVGGAIVPDKQAAFQVQVHPQPRSR
jgi:hypothetical protein